MSKLLLAGGGFLSLASGSGSLLLEEEGVAPSAFVLELEFSAGVWTDVRADAVGALDLKYGKWGSGPTDLVADVGTSTFSLDNSSGNSGGLQGYYSPNHANVRSGFAQGIGIRVGITYGGTTYYKFRGRVVDIDPLAGQFREQHTLCQAVDWMEDLSRFNARNLAPQQDQDSGSLVTTLIAAMPTAAQPAAQSIDAGTESYAYALHDMGSKMSGRALAQRICQSEFGQLAVIGDTTQGGTVRFFNRQHRRQQVVAARLNNRMDRLEAASTADLAINRAIVAIHPTRVDPEPTKVLFSMAIDPETVRPLVPASTSVTFWGTYTDPDNENQLVGGVDQVTPVETTDYTMNRVSGGTGTDETSNFTVVATFFATTVKFVVTAGANDAYVTKLQCRGRGVYDDTPLELESSSTQDYGERSLTLQMPYQSSPVLGQAVADFLEDAYSDVGDQPTAVGFLANRSDARMTDALAREPGDLVELTEPVTGLAAAEAFINGVSLTLGPGILVRCLWHLSPNVEGGPYFKLDNGDLLDDGNLLGYF